MTEDSKMLASKYANKRFAEKVLIIEKVFGLIAAKKVWIDYVQADGYSSSSKQLFLGCKIFEDFGIFGLILRQNTLVN